MIVSDTFEVRVMISYDVDDVAVKTRLHSQFVVYSRKHIFI